MNRQDKAHRMTWRMFPWLLSVCVLLLCPFSAQSGSMLHKGDWKGPTLTDVRHAALPDHTRVVLDLTSSVQFETHALEADANRSLPPRIYVDLLGTRLVTEKRLIKTSGGHLHRVRLGQYKPDVVRVVLDLKGLGEYQAFILPDPYRLVLDVRSNGSGPRGSGLVRKRAKPQPVAPRIRKIVLDPGHGGKDPGAIGPRGVKEKDIVLVLAKKLAHRLRRDMGVHVVLTRSADIFIPLEDRTAMANAENADLFISLHVNASENKRAGGLETYYLDNTTDEAAIRLAARENSTSRRNVTDLQFILSDLVQNSKLADSITLANYLQSSLVSRTRRRYHGVKDLGVKKGLFYVLVGARMPSVLVELFFVTNKLEARNLTRRRFQGSIVEGIYQGIRKYQQSLKVVKNL